MSAIELAVFDMDGCLYTHKDPNHHLREGFYDTYLGKAVASAIVEFIKINERQDVDDVYSNAVKDEVGPSEFLGNRYGITRKEYFDQTWGKISTEKFIDDDDIRCATEVIQSFREKEIELHLLTAAPSVWASKVLSQLGLISCFEAFSYGEDFGKKHEVFQRIAEQISPEKVLSIGDEYKNDILPAEQLGMQTYLVSSETPLRGVIERIDQT